MCLKCVGYDEEFQKELVEEFANWVPRPSKPKPKPKSNPKQALKVKGKKKNSKVVKPVDSEDDSDYGAVITNAEPEAMESDTDDRERIRMAELDEDEEDDEGGDEDIYVRRAYRHEGTKSRPRRSG